MTASAMAVPIAAAANHARRRPRTAGNRRRGRRTRKPSADSTIVTATTDAAESSPSVASTVHSMSTASRLTPAARPAHDSGLDAVRHHEWAERDAGKREEEDGYHRREDGGGQQRDGIHGQSLKPRPGRVTADEAIGRRDEESLGSVRQRLATLPREHWILLGILGIVVVVHGWRALQPFFIRRRPPLPLGPDPHDPAGHVPARRAVCRVCRPTTRRDSTSSSPAWPRSPGSTSRARRRCSGSCGCRSSRSGRTCSPGG